MTGLLQETIALWRESPAGLPQFERSFQAQEQAAREAELELFLANVEAELRSLPHTRSEREAARDRLTAAFARFAGQGLDLEDRHLDLLLNDGFAAIGTDMARRARRFDPTVSASDILQASRNAWTACALQGLLGQKMRLTSAIFAYSMLYPYTDNYLDDPAAPREAKLAFSAHLGGRLAGEDVAPANGREAVIWRLVEMIEAQYDRSEWPEVFSSLLGIHRAQQDSIRLLREGRSAGEVEVLPLSFAKGGASVLADAYLAAGALSPEEARFVFGWGVALQLADDLQDVRQDRRDRARTLFSEAAGREPLDALTSRTLNFAQGMERLMDPLPRSNGPTLKELVRRSSRSLLVRSAGEAGDLYSDGYLAELETHSPFRFSFLNRQQRYLRRRTGPMTRLFEAFLAGDEDEAALPLLPLSLLPRA